MAAAAHRFFSRVPTTSIDCRALFPESDDAALSSGVSVNADTVTVLREAANVSKVHLILQDTSPDGLLEAVVKSSLDGVGALGSAAGQVPRHRFLVCTTRIGKVALVRQIEAAQHVEREAAVHDQLSQFSVPQWLVAEPGADGSLVQRVLASAA